MFYSTNRRLEKTSFAWRRHWASGSITHFQVTAVKLLFRACERSGAAEFPAHRSAPFTGVLLTAPQRSFDFLTRSAPAPQQGRI